jgi:hypothetical protein
MIQERVRAGLGRAVEGGKRLHCARNESVSCGNITLNPWRSMLQDAQTRLYLAVITGQARARSKGRGLHRRCKSIIECTSMSCGGDYEKDKGS